MKQILLWPAVLLAACAPDRVATTCETCSIVVEEEVRLAADGGATVGPRVARTSAGDYLVAPTYEPGTIAVHGPDGAFRTRFGRPGGGPGEFRAPSLLAVGAGDTVVVVDGPSARWTGPDRDFVGAAPLPGRTSEIVVLSDGRVLAHAQSIGRPDMPTLFIAARDGTPPVRFATDSTGRRYAGVREVAVRGEEIWSVGKLDVEIERFSVDGRRASAFRLDHPWFPDHRLRRGLGGLEATDAQVADVVFDEDGRLWLLLFRQREDWRPPSRATQGTGEARPTRLSAAELRDRFERRLDVVDVDGRAVIATRALDDAPLAGFIDGGRAFAPEEGRDGIALVVWSLRVEGAP